MIRCISLTFWTSVSSVSFLQDTSAREHTLGNVTLEAVLFSFFLFVSLVNPKQGEAKQLAEDKGWRKASRMRLGPKCMITILK